MILMRHVFRVVGATLAYSFSTRKVALAVLVLVGILLVALTLATQVVAPIIVYPFV